MRWSEDEQIFFLDSYGYGLTPSLTTISLGKEADIEETLKTGKIKDDLPPTQKQVLTDILEYRKELEIGDTGTKDMVRACPIGASRYREKDTRQIKKSGRIPLHKINRKKQSVSGG